MKEVSKAKPYSKKIQHLVIASSRAITHGLIPNFVQDSWRGPLLRKLHIHLVTGV